MSDATGAENFAQPIVQASLPEDEQLGTVADRREISAEEALRRLQQGEALYDARVVGLSFRKLTITTPVKIKNCLLVRPNFEAAVFQEDVSIVASTIDRGCFAKHPTFEKGLHLNGSTVMRTSFHQVHVKGAFDWSNGISRDKLAFNGCKFDGTVRFWDSRWDGWADFNKCHFAQSADFRSVHAYEGLVIQKCTFQQDFLFRGSAVEKKFDLNSSRFEGLIDLSKAKFRDFAYLESIDQGPQQTFAFLNTVADRLLIEPKHLTDRLANEKQGHWHDAMQEYGLLKQSFQNLHRYDQEDWAFYRFKVNQRRAAGSSPQAARLPARLKQFFSWLFLDLGCGYGTNPTRAIRMAVAIIVLFALFYMAGARQLHVEHPPFEGDIGSWPNRIMIGMVISVSVFTSGLGGIRDVAQGWLNIPLLVESLLGTLLWGLFVVAFSRKVIR